MEVTDDTEPCWCEQCVEDAAALQEALEAQEAPNPVLDPARPAAPLQRPGGDLFLRYGLILILTVLVIALGAGAR